MESLVLKIMDVEATIRNRNIMEVTSPFARESSSPELDRNGLFSEEIFGAIASTERLVTHGYINLKTPILHPKIYRSIIKLKSYYKNIISGKQDAIFDKASGEFIRVEPDDESGDTGYSFFMKHYKDLKFKKTKSLTRNSRIDSIDMFRREGVFSKLLVMPAGLRDLDLADMTNSSEEINKHYLSILNLCQALPLDGSDNPIFDVVKFSIQNKLNFIYEYIINILDDKNGFLQKKYGARNLALGTRNVISPAKFGVGSASSDYMIKANETMVPLYNFIMAFQPVVNHGLLSTFFSPIFSNSASNISLVEPKTGALKYVSVDLDTVDKFTTSDGISSLMRGFRDPKTRHKPVVVYDHTGSPYYLMLTYKDPKTKEFFMFRNLEDFKRQYEGIGKTFNPELVKPLTRYEMFFIACQSFASSKHVMVTRYPITGANSIYPSKVHLITTAKSETYELKSPMNPDKPGVKMPHFPIFGESSIDSAVLHPSHLANLGGDFDGDMVNINGCIADDVNEEIAEYLNHPRYMVSVDKNLQVGLSTDLCKMTFFNMSVIN